MANCDGRAHRFPSTDVAKLPCVVFSLNVREQSQLTVASETEQIGCNPFQCCEGSGMTSQGDVLEISVGTGRNLPYYKLSQLASLTMVDTSQNMLDAAKKKLREIAWNTEGAYKVKTRFVCANAADPSLSRGGSF